MGEMHPDFPDEDAAVMESVKYLRACGATQGTM